MKGSLLYDSWPKWRLEFKGTKKMTNKMSAKSRGEKDEEVKREKDKGRNYGHNLGAVCRILQHSKLHSSTQNAQIVPDMIPS